MATLLASRNFKSHQLDNGALPHVVFNQTYEREPTRELSALPGRHPNCHVPPALD